jgi:exosortase/archaeosortase family protein
MNNIKTKITFMILRYLSAMAAAIALPLFYIVLRPITVYPVFFITSLIYAASLQADLLIIGPYSIEFVDACIAGSAYVLLFILNMLVAMDLKKRIYMLFLDFFLLFLFNIARIVILIILLVNNSLAFDFTHKLFWYALSTGFVALIWFLNIIIFKIKNIPIYSDIKFVLKNIKKKAK